MYLVKTQNSKLLVCLCWHNSNITVVITYTKEICNIQFYDRHLRNKWERQEAFNCEKDGPFLKVLTEYSLPNGRWLDLELLRELPTGIKYDFWSMSFEKNRFSILPLPIVSRWTGLCGAQTKQAWHFHFWLKRNITPLFCFVFFCLNFGGYLNLWVLWTVVFTVILVMCVSRNKPCK